MDTGQSPHPSDPDESRAQRRADVRKASRWLGNVVVAQVIAYIVRHWLP
jgi:hypothetical protein